MFLLPLSVLSQQDYLMDEVSSSTIYTCSGTFYDDGGSAGNYSNDVDFEEVTFCADNGGKISFNFSSFSIEADADCEYDEFFILGEENTSGFVGYCGTDNPGVVVSEGNCLTFLFYSDGSITESGWEAVISCDSNILPESDLCCDPESSFISNPSFEGNMSPDESFPNTSLSPTANSINVGTSENWLGWYGAAQNLFNVDVISDASRGSDGEEFMYLGYPGSSSENYCASNQTPATVSTNDQVCAAGSDIINEVRYGVCFDWVPFDKQSPSGTSNTTIPRAEYNAGNGLILISLFDTNGDPAGSRAGVNWNNVSNSWEQVCGIVMAFYNESEVDFYFSHDANDNSGMLLDNITTTEILMDAPNMSNIEIGSQTDQITFDLSPVSTVTSFFDDLTYAVEAPVGYTISPAVGIYGISTTFTITNIAGDDLSDGNFADIDIITMDAINRHCQVTSTITGSDVEAEDPCDPVSSGNIDTDNDGISDVCDLDDDNDGILDTDEKTCVSNEFSAGWFSNAPWGTRSQDGLWADGPNGAPVYPGRDSTIVASSTDFTFGSGLTATVFASRWNISSVGEANFISAKNNNDFVSYEFTTPSIAGGFPEAGVAVSKVGFGDWDLAPYLIAVEITDNSSSNTELLVDSINMLGSSGYQYLPFDNLDYSGFLLSPSTSYTFKVYLYGATDSNTLVAFDDFQFGVCKLNDTDSDGIADYLDTDSDNDGCPDAIEGGGGFTYDDVQSDRLAGNADVNGIPVAATSSGQNIGSSINAGQQSDECDSCNNNSTLFSDNDEDGVGDACDLDDDNDGILDTDETGICAMVPITPGHLGVLGGALDTTVSDKDISFRFGKPAGTITMSIVNANAINSGSNFVTNATTNSSPRDEMVVTINSSLPYKVQTEHGRLITAVGKMDYTSSDASLEYVGDNLSSGYQIVQNGNQYGVERTSSSTGNAGTTGGGFVWTTEDYQLGSYTTTIGTSDENGNFNYIRICLARDTDGDNIADYLDTDSDNDGCPDASEGADQLVTTATLSGGSNGGSSDNLGINVDSDGIPFSANGGQDTMTATYSAQRVVVDSIPHPTYYEGENHSITIIGGEEQYTNTFNAGVPDFNSISFTDTLEYQWFKDSDPGTILSTTQTLDLIGIDSDDAGDYTVLIGGVNNGCPLEENFTITVIVRPNSTMGINDANQIYMDSLAIGNVLMNDLDMEEDNQEVSLIDLDGDGIPETTPQAGVNNNVLSNGVIIGQIELDPESGDYSFQPALGYTEDVDIAMTICDDNVNSVCDESVLTIIILPPGMMDDNTIMARNDHNRQEQGSTTYNSILSNDTDMNGDPISVSGAYGLDQNGDSLALTSSPQNVYDDSGNLAGTAHLNMQDEVVFVADLNFHGDVMIDYSINDGNGATDNATLTIEVTSNNSAYNDIVADDDYNAAGINESQSGNVLDNDNDPEDDSFEVNDAEDANENSIVIDGMTTNVLPSGGTLIIDTDGTYTYTPANNFTGTEVILYEICDDNAQNQACDMAYLYLTSVQTLTALPVEWLSFDVEYISDKVIINWKTAAEINSDHFIVQRSIDGIVFEDLNKVSAAGNSSTITSYDAFDHDPAEGLNYYRIKQVDLDGSYDHSNIRSVNVVSINSAHVDLYPNPTHSNLRITVEGGFETVGNFTVHDLSGKIVLNGVLTDDFISVEELPSGTYFLQIDYQEQIFEVKKFIVLR